MTEFHEISSKDFIVSPFYTIGQQWMLVAAENGGITNALTASWGGLGHMWNKDVAYIVIRPQRFTKPLIDQSGHFSLSFFPETYRSELNYFGTASGRDEDKIAKAMFNVQHVEGVPYFAEAQTAILCKTLYAQKYEAECFTDKRFANRFYPENDFHTLYIAEVLHILGRDVH